MLLRSSVLEFETLRWSVDHALHRERKRTGPVVRFQLCQRRVDDGASWSSVVDLYTCRNGYELHAGTCQTSPHRRKKANMHKCLLGVVFGMCPSPTCVFVPRKLHRGKVVKCGTTWDGTNKIRMGSGEGRSWVGWSHRGY